MSESRQTLRDDFGSAAQPRVAPAPRPEHVQRLAVGAGLLVGVVGAVHLAAWLSGVYTTSGLSTITLKTNAALCLLLLGTSLALLARPVRPVGRWVARGLAAGALVVATLTLFENITDYDLGIDQLLAAEPPGALGVTSPNRFGCVSRGRSCWARRRGSGPSRGSPAAGDGPPQHRDGGAAD